MTSLIARGLKVLVEGAASKQGVADPAIKAGAPVTVIVEEAGRRVKELHVDPAVRTGAPRKGA